jgi:predicted MFS family arabinose efflux permease
MQTFALGWLVVELADHEGRPQLASLYLGLVGLSRAIPALTLALVGGVIADRVDRRRVLLLTQSTAAACALGLGLLTLSGSVTIGAVLALSAVSVATTALDAPARISMLPRIVGAGDLPSAFGLNAVAVNGATFVGPLAGGLLISPFGAGGIFVLNAVSYLAVIAALLLMRPLPPAARAAQSAVDSLREGLRFVRRDPLVGWLVLLLLASCALSRPYLQLLPAFAHEVLGLGAVGLSWLLGASGFGALVGSLAIAAFGAGPRRGLVLLIGLGSVGALLALASVERALAIEITLFALLGLALMVFNGLFGMLLQLGAPDRLRGRVTSVQSLIIQGAVPLGVAGQGALGSLVGVETVLLWGGLLTVVVGLYAIARASAVRQVSALVVPSTV